MNSSTSTPIVCVYCGNPVDALAMSCPNCGAVLKRRLSASDSGWNEAAPIKDMSRLRVGNSTCQIEGLYVPVADFNLDAADSVYFAHHTVLWKDPQVEIKRMPMAGGWKRMMAGLPVVMTSAHGPGHIAFSKDDPGEIIALPLTAGQSIDVREHMLLVATGNVVYDYFQTHVWYTTRPDKDIEWNYPVGAYMDRFTAGAGNHGLVLLHAGGNVFVRTLQAGQTLLINPHALIYKDVSVRMTLDVQYFTGMLNMSRRVLWVRLTGPGKVAIQSAYAPLEDENNVILDKSPEF
jgi:uncharacterized protein (AIM24 family)